MSTQDQDLLLQLDALAATGCGKVFEDRASGTRADRPGLKAAGDRSASWIRVLSNGES